MKTYYPLLSVGAAALAILVPLTIVALGSARSEPTAKDSTGDALLVRSHEQQLRELRERLETLQATVERLDAVERARSVDRPFFPPQPEPPATVLEDSAHSASKPEESDHEPPKRAASNQQLDSATKQTDSTALPVAESPAAVGSWQALLDGLKRLGSQTAAATATTVPSSASTEADDDAMKTSDEMMAETAGSKTGMSPLPAETSPDPGPTKPKTDREKVADAMKFLAKAKDEEEEKKKRAVNFKLAVVRPPAGSQVRQTVDLFATTQEPGWPVILVRSDIDGDQWWVQQVVERRGIGIAARVTFGNDDTIPNQPFELVVLLLDTQAEAVRFRTARKFEQLPEGIRRSQVFRFVRR